MSNELRGEGAYGICPISFSPEGPEGFSALQNPLPTANLISGTAVGADHKYFERAERNLKAGLWRSEPYTEWYHSYPCDEFMYMLQGEVFVENDVCTKHYTAGSAFLIPRGFQGYWRQPVAVVKYYVIVG